MSESLPFTVRRPGDAAQHFVKVCECSHGEGVAAFEQLGVAIEQYLSSVYSPEERSVYCQAAARSTRSSWSGVRCKKDAESAKENRDIVKSRYDDESEHSLPPPIFPPKPASRPLERKVSVSQLKKVAKAFNTSILVHPHSSPFPQDVFPFSAIPSFVSAPMHCLQKVLEVVFLSHSLPPCQGDLPECVMQYYTERALSFICDQLGFTCQQANLTSHTRLYLEQCSLLPNNWLSGYANTLIYYNHYPILALIMKRRTNHLAYQYQAIATSFALTSAINANSWNPDNINWQSESCFCVPTILFSGMCAQRFLPVGKDMVYRDEHKFVGDDAIAAVWSVLRSLAYAAQSLSISSDVHPKIQSLDPRPPLANSLQLDRIMPRIHTSKDSIELGPPPRPLSPRQRSLSRERIAKFFQDAAPAKDVADLDIGAFDASPGSSNHAELQSPSVVMATESDAVSSNQSSSSSLPSGLPSPRTRLNMHVIKESSFIKD